MKIHSKKDQEKTNQNQCFYLVPSLQLTHHCQCLLQQCYNFKKQEETVSSSDTAGDGSKALSYYGLCTVP